MGLSITIAAVFASSVIFRSESRGTHDHILLSQIWDTPNLEDQVPVFVSPRYRMARLYPQALGFIFCASWMCELYYDRRPVGQSVLVSSTHLGLMTRFLLLSDNSRFVDVGRLLWREGGSVLYYVHCTIYLHFTCYLALFILTHPHTFTHTPSLPHTFTHTHTHIRIVMHTHAHSHSHSSIRLCCPGESIWRVNSRQTDYST
jgi:hypothetical protein